MRSRIDCGSSITLAWISGESKAVFGVSEVDFGKSDDFKAAFNESTGDFGESGDFNAAFDEFNDDFRESDLSDMAFDIGDFEDAFVDTFAELFNGSESVVLFIGKLFISLMT